MIADLLRLSALYVLTRVFIEIAFPSLKHLVKYLFWAGVALTIVGVIGPRANKLLDDIHSVSVTYSQGKQVVQNGLDTVDNVTSWPELKETIPIIGSGPSKAPPATGLSDIIPWNKPFSWPVKGKITQGFNSNNHGLDIACTEGTVIKTARDGKIIAINSNEAYGNFIVIDHGGQWQTLYAHLTDKLVVKNGQLINEGQTLGYCGVTGNSTGPHLHFEVRVGGKTVDPTQFLK